MTNSARRLHDLCQSWAVPDGKFPSDVRSNQDPDSLDFWRDHLIAVSYLMDINRFLDGQEAAGREVAYYRAAVPDWHKAVFAYNTPWGSPGRTVMSPAMNSADFRLLLALSGLMEEAGWQITFSQNDCENLQKALGKARDLARSDESIGSDTRRYILALIAEAQSALDDLDVAGDARLRSVSLELGGAMVSVADATNEDPKDGRWRKAAAAVLKSIGSGAKQIAIGAATGYVMGQIPS